MCLCSPTSVARVAWLFEFFFSWCWSHFWFIDLHFNFGFIKLSHFSSEICEAKLNSWRVWLLPPQMWPVRHSRHNTPLTSASIKQTSCNAYSSAERVAKLVGTLIRTASSPPPFSFQLSHFSQVTKSVLLSMVKWTHMNWCTTVDHEQLAKLQSLVIHKENPSVFFNGICTLLDCLLLYESGREIGAILSDMVFFLAKKHFIDMFDVPPFVLSLALSLCLSWARRLPLVWCRPIRYAPLSVRLMHRFPLTFETSCPSSSFWILWVVC